MKNTIKYHYVTTRMAIIKKTNNKSVVKNMEKLERSDIDAENLKLYRHLGKCW